MIKAKFRGLLAALALLAIIAAPIRAADEAKAPASPKAYIVLVGISNYADNQINPRPHAVADVQAIYDVFTNAEYMGVDKDHIRLLLGGAEDAARGSQPATHENILKAVKWIATEPRADDLVVFTFIECRRGVRAWPGIGQTQEPEILRISRRKLQGLHSGEGVSGSTHLG